jgi:hypothetical protein
MAHTAPYGPYGGGGMLYHNTFELHNWIGPSADHSFSNQPLAKIIQFSFLEHAVLHKKGIEICQEVNGGISFHLTAQETGV